MEISTTQNPEIIEKLWNKLNNHHYEKTNNLKNYFKNLNFKKRVEAIKKDHIFFIVKENNVIIGFCIASVDNYCGEIISMYVEKNYRKRKIATNLLKAAEKWIKSKNCNSLFLLVSEGNENVFEFYLKNGYKKKDYLFEKEI